MTQTVEALTEIQPGEAVDVRLTRISPSGDWCASIGGVEGEEALAQTAAWPWEALRGLAKQVKERTGELAQFRLAGEQEMGRCAHASPDGTLCCVLECPTGGAGAIVRALKAAGGNEALVLGPEFYEIVRLHGKLEKPRLVGEEEGEELTVTMKVTGDDLVPEYHFVRNEAGNHVLAIIYHREPPPQITPVDPDQQALPLSEEGGEPEEVLGETESVQDLVCPACGSRASSEYVSVGRTCIGCEKAAYEQITPSETETSGEPQ